MSIEAMKQALEALEKMVTPRNFQTHQFCQKAYDDLRQAIAEAEKQEPVDSDGSPCPEFWDWLPKAYRDGDIGDAPRFTKYNMEVAFLAGKQSTHPPKREWVGLTDEEIESLDCVYLNWLDYEEVEIKGEKEFARAIEAKLKTKNGFPQEEKNG